MARQSINTLPQADADFITNLTEYLLEEFADRAAYMFPGFNRIYSGMLGTTSGTLVHTISAGIGFPNHKYVAIGATSHSYEPSAYTFVYVVDDDEATIDIGGATVTFDGHLVFATMALASPTPTTPAGCLPLMRVITSAEAVTAVLDRRTTALPWGSGSGGASIFTPVTVVPTLVDTNTYDLELASDVNLWVTIDDSGLASGATSIIRGITGTVQAGQMIVLTRSTGTEILRLTHDDATVDYPFQCALDVEADADTVSTLTFLCDGTNFLAIAGSTNSAGGGLPPLG